MSSPPYSTSQLLTTVMKNPTVLVPTPSTTSTWESGDFRNITYSTIKLPAGATEDTTFQVTGPGGPTGLRRQGQEHLYTVIAIGQPLPSNESTSTTTTGNSASQPRSKPTAEPAPSPPAAPTDIPVATGGATLPTPLPAQQTGSSDNAPKVVAGVIGGLFLLTLAALLFLIFKLRKAAKDRALSPPAMVFTETSSAKGQSTISELSARNTDLMNQLEERNAQLSALQATLMRSNRIERLGHYTFQVHGTAPRSFTGAARDPDFSGSAIRSVAAAA
ncbi:unnamed protein product [Tuber melanosporum]|uniref:(Perigord truffle) hypothetical protein n=1 Tax=Tuber melanosporum (strain Mel28) TaxID=656061 RepID=D5G525_TUBMM|nr:uncharacterized protein GSTUM_00000333001 [Tuber melanosporum]CAZ79618.1 unnamed protein product [Tuber melanosporum]